MGERIRQLEDALAILQAKHTNDPHPLLRDDALITTKSEPQYDNDALASQTTQKQGDVIEAFGTLSVYDHGVSRFFGPSGGTEVCFLIRLKWSAERFSRSLLASDQFTLFQPQRLPFLIPS